MFGNGEQAFLSLTVPCNGTQHNSRVTISRSSNTVWADQQLP